MNNIGKTISNTYVNIKQRTAIAVTTALGLLIAFVWNDTIKSIINYYYPPEKIGSLGAKVIYAIILTAIVVIFQMYLFSNTNTNNK
jgi:hypothetical protein